jgi:hypothetical protein
LGAPRKRKACPHRFRFHLHLGLFLWQITDVIKRRMEELDAVLGLSSMKTPSMCTGSWP